MSCETHPCEADFMKQVCADVKVEPELILIAAEIASGNNAVKARLDISARGVWALYQKAFFDIRVTHPNAESHMRKSLETL